MGVYGEHRQLVAPEPEQAAAAGSAEACPPPSGIAIVGAGPAGLLAAQRCAEAGVRVTIFEQKPAPARKFLMAGRGGLNLTHTTPLPQALAKYGGHCGALDAALMTFTPLDMRAWATNLGIDTFIGSSGRVFPIELKASPLLRAWLQRLDQLGVTFCFRHRWDGWSPTGTLRFTVTHGDPAVSETHIELSPAATILTVGGASWPRLGSDGAWAQHLEPLTEPFAPSNAGLTIAWSDHMIPRHAGAPLKNIALSVFGETIRGEVIISRGGLEGGCCYALNPAVRAARTKDDQRNVPLHIDLKPDLTAADLAERLSRTRRAGQSLANRLRQGAGLVPAAIALLREADAKNNRNENHTPLSACDDASLAARIKAAPLACTGLDGLERAISSVGGVKMTAVDEAYQLVSRPGVFVAGEMLDWDAPTGGYLLQAAFATAAKAADGALTYLAREQSAAPDNAPEQNPIG